jgi:DNA-binding CsgD family transcriptional regulator
VAPPGELLRSFYGLTLAESALTRELSNGHSLADAASRLDITYGTARQRLGQVFAKTRTTRQAELVHLVLTGPESLLAEE